MHTCFLCLKDIFDVYIASGLSCQCSTTELWSPSNSGLLAWAASCSTTELWSPSNPWLLAWAAICSTTELWSPSNSGLLAKAASALQLSYDHHPTQGFWPKLPVLYNWAMITRQPPAHTLYRWCCSHIPYNYTVRTLLGGFSPSGKKVVSCNSKCF